MTAPTPPREGRPEWMTREWVNHAMDCPWVISYGATAQMAREILACWDQIAELRRELEQARAELAKTMVSDSDVAAGIRTLRANFEAALLAAEAIGQALRETSFGSKWWPQREPWTAARATDDDGC